MISGGFDTLSHIMEIYFSGPDEENVSDDLAEALMRGTIRDLRAAVQNPEDYDARSNLMWEATMAENRIIKLNKLTDFQAHMMEHQLGAYTGCNHGQGLAAIHPAYYRLACGRAPEKFARFAVNVWGISQEGKSKLELARAGVEALADFIAECGLPVRLRDLRMKADASETLRPAVLKEIADSCNLIQTGPVKLTHEDLLGILTECL